MFKTFPVQPVILILGTIRWKFTIWQADNIQEKNMILIDDIQLTLELPRWLLISPLVVT